MYVYDNNDLHAEVYNYLEKNKILYYDYFLIHIYMYI